jgi:hypothetical protein
MQIKLDEEQIDEVMFTGLLSLEESFPNDKKLSKAIKRVLSYTMAPSDWEMIYDRNWEKYSDDNDRDDITFSVDQSRQGYDLGGYDFDSLWILTHQSILIIRFQLHHHLKNKRLKDHAKEINNGQKENADQPNF